MVAYYSANDSITFTVEGAGKRGTLQIEEVSKSGIAEVKVDADGGSGYAIGDAIVPDNTGTEGTGFIDPKSEWSMVDLQLRLKIEQDSN